MAPKNKSPAPKKKNIPSKESIWVKVQTAEGLKRAKMKGRLESD